MAVLHVRVGFENSYARVSTNNTGPQDDVELMDRQLASDSDVDV